MQLPEAQVYWWLEENVSAENEAKVTELRQALGALLVPGLDDRVSLLRFLKARHWNVVKAAKMYQVRLLFTGAHAGASAQLEAAWEEQRPLCCWQHHVVHQSSMKLCTLHSSRQTYYP